MASKVLPPIPHLASRPKALALFGWTGAAAEWLALVCLHSGVFTRVQYCHRFDVGPWGAHRFVRRLVEAGVAAEHPLPALRTTARVCHVFGRRLYRALGVEHTRLRRLGTEVVVFRKLLSLDFVMERPDLPLARHRAGEGGPLRGARDQACYPPAARLRRSCGALTALLPPESACGPWVLAGWSSSTPIPVPEPLASSPIGGNCIALCGPSSGDRGLPSTWRLPSVPGRRWSGTRPPSRGRGELR